ncbi:MAG: flagellar basal body rod protein FlgC [Peptococcaceae bacterium]|jgi:flagellar basal-body rod protein FlgC|nr:flagellar basal body rod protein FlgC [Peptococcaceae bacterium]
MGLFGGIDASASGLTAQRLRLDLISSNIANISTTRTGRTTAAGSQIPYRRQEAIFIPRPEASGFAGVLNQALSRRSGIAAGMGVGTGVQVAAIVEDPIPFKLEYDPSSPDAAAEGDPEVPVGYVRYPNVDIVMEMVNMISASRSYEANVTALNASKSMFLKALEIGR